MIIFQWVKVNVEVKVEVEVEVEVESEEKEISVYFIQGLSVIINPFFELGQKTGH